MRLFPDSNGCQPLDARSRKNLSSECPVITIRCALNGCLDLKRDLLSGHSIIDLGYILAKRIYPTIKHLIFLWCRCSLCALCSSRSSSSCRPCCSCCSSCSRLSSRSCRAGFSSCPSGSRCARLSLLRYGRCRFLLRLLRLITANQSKS